MNTEQIRLYIRSILLLIVCFAFLQICTYIFLKTPGRNQLQVLPNRSVWATLGNGISFGKYSNSINRSSNYLKLKRGDGVSDITRQIYEISNASVKLNERQFGALDADSVVVVVQVHQGISKLKALIESLSRARGISKALVVFSHDFFDEAINECVQAIGFCKVLQLYYLHSIQSNPDFFPETDPFDCPRFISLPRAVGSNLNTIYPGINGNYTERKYHWWWKANYLFNRHNQTKYHHGLFLFLEEDSIVVEDILFVLDKMKAVAGESFPNCSVLCLGKKQKPLRYSKPYFSLTTWSKGEDCSAIAFNRTTWSGILDCASDFCTYEGYNWEKSLDFVNDKCLKHKLYVMTMHDPRVYSTGNWSQENFYKAKKAFYLAAKGHRLYPPKLKNLNAVASTTVELARGEMSGGVG